MMKTKLEYAMQSLIFNAKLFLESRHSKEKNLEWTYAATIDSKGIETRAEMYVLNVKRPLGYIVASYAVKKVKVMDGNLSSLITYDVKE